jgi:outer membrane biosynthesis protein TonB
MRLVLTTIALFLAAGTISAQRLESCETFSSKYRAIEDQALIKVAAHYPSEPGLRLKGRVTVLLVVDRRGRVVSTRALCGHPLLVATLEAAARTWMFKPARNRARRVGTISFDFVPTDAFSRTGGA